MEPPTFPSEFVVERVRQLGYGTRWTRERLVSIMNETTADKFIRDARAAGWLVSPSRGVYQIPSASDLMTVSWLSGALREEFLIARSLAAANVRAWCLSAWCRDQGLDLGGPLFVTDLQDRPVPLRPARPSLASLRDEARRQAKQRDALPWADALVIIPYVPALDAAPRVELVEVPESPAVQERRQTEGVIGAGVLSLLSLATWAITKQPPAGMDKLDALLEFGRVQRSIPYTVGPRVGDTAWIIGLLASFGLARADELALKMARDLDPALRTEAYQAAAWIGPPQPNVNWRATLAEGPFPYLLVPPVLWNQLGPEQAARRARTLGQLVGDIPA